MSRARKCDRCGRLYPLEDRTRYTRIVVCRYEPDYRYLGDATRRTEDRDLDLCPKCTVLFDEFFNAIDLNKEKENAED